MRAVIVDGTGLEHMRVATVADPGEPGPGMALVKCHAWSLNYRDIMVAEGRYGRALEEPQVAGSDMAGEVIAVGPGVEHLKNGDKVLNAPITGWVAGKMTRAYTRSFLGGGGIAGVMAEKVLLPAAALVKFDKLEYAQAATLPVAGLTAWSALITHGKLNPGGTALCLGTGGVSIFAAQIAHAMKCPVVITSSSDEKLARAGQMLGSELTGINYAQYPDWHKAVLEVTDGEGVDVVVETVGGASLDKSVQSVCFGGRVCVIGVLDGVESSVNVAKILSRQVEIIGIYMESISELKSFVKFFETSHIRPVIGRHFDLSEAPAAYAYLKSQNHFGKIVLEVD